MNAGSLALETQGLLVVARRWWVTLLLATLLATAGGVLLASSRPVDYESRVRLLVGPVNTNNETLRASGQLARTYAELATSRSLLQATIAGLDLAVAPQALAERVDTTADSATRIVIVRVTDRDPVMSARIADDLSQRLRRYADRRGSGVEGRMTVVDAAAPGLPPAGGPALLGITTGLAGLVAAFTVVVLVEYLRRPIRDEHELAACVGAPTLGVCPPAPRRRAARRPPVVQRAPASAAAARYRLLAAKVELYAESTGSRVLLFQETAGASRTDVALVNIAAALADHHRVAVLDGSQASGGQILHGAPKSADLFLVRVPDLDRSPVGLELARLVDGVVVVAGAHRSQWRAVTQTVESLHFVGATVMGTLLVSRRAGDLPRLGLAAAFARHWRAVGALLGQLRQRARSAPTPRPASVGEAEG